MWALLTHHTFLPLCRTGTGMCFSYSLEPPCQPLWMPLGKVSVSNTKWISRRWQKCTFKSDPCFNSTVQGNLDERTADNSSWQQHSIPALSSTNEFREYEKPQVMNHFHYAYILIRLGLALALHSGEYEMQENLEACKRWDRNSTGLSQI